MKLAEIKEGMRVKTTLNYQYDKLSPATIVFKLGNQVLAHFDDPHKGWSFGAEFGRSLATYERDYPGITRKIKPYGKHGYYWLYDIGIKRAKPLSVDTIFDAVSQYIRYKTTIPNFKKLALAHKDATKQTKQGKRPVRRRVGSLDKKAKTRKE